MKLNKPFEISSRLLPAIKINEATISFDPKTLNFYIDFPKGKSHKVTDFSPGACHNIQKCFEDILDFMAACGESYAFEQRNKGLKGDHTDLFPKHIAKWCAVPRNNDELTLTRIDLEENDNLIEE